MTNLITRNARHEYTYQGITYPGVTGILGASDDKQGLVPWAAKQTALAALGLINSKDTDGRTAADVLIASSGEDAFVKAISNRNAWQRDEAAKIGSEIHAMAELVVTGRPTPPMDENIRGRVLAYADWWQRSGWKLRAAEALLVNPTAGYGGTLDLLCWDAAGKCVLADIKTGKNVYAQTALQLAAYGMAEWAQVGTVVYAMPPVDRYVIIHVTTDGVREIEVPVDQPEQSAFYAALALYEWKEQIKSRHTWTR